MKQEFCRDLIDAELKIWHLRRKKQQPCWFAFLYSCTLQNKNMFFIWNVDSQIIKFLPRSTQMLSTLIMCSYFRNCLLLFKLSFFLLPENFSECCKWGRNIFAPWLGLPWTLGKKCLKKIRFYHFTVLKQSFPYLQSISLLLLFRKKDLKYTMDICCRCGFP